MKTIKSIQNRIYEIRGERVILDQDLAILYETENKRLKEAVRRNIKRFPADFMFQLTKDEYENIIQYIEELEPHDLRTQIASSSHGGTRYLPYAFTEQGVAMLSGVLSSEKAISMNIAIMRAFVDIRKLFLAENNLKDQLKEIKERLGEHDVQLNQIYDAMENLLDEKIVQRKWEDREQIGFKNNHVN
ncbi:MAG: ORF6N domain-containing protein [Rhizobacter sp.]|nr:ORF6N domain-containing protein [Ferruginibacter sp.]